MYLIVILFITFLFYKSSLFYYFISDDFLGFAKYKGFIDLIKIDPNNNHYSPLVKVIGSFLFKIFAYNPFPYHFYTILLHLLNIYLVYSLSKMFFNNRSKNLITALIFAFFFANYEVVFWNGANNNSLLVTFYILSLILLIKFVKNKKSLFSILFQICFICALLTHEYAISLIPVAIIYWWLFTSKKSLKEFAKLFLFPILAVIATVILKEIFVKIPLAVRTFSIFKFIAFTLRSFVYLFIPNPYLIDKIPNFFIPIIFLIIFAILFKNTKNKRTLFLLIWTTLTIFVYSATSAPQARYFYLSFIPVIIYIISVVNFRKIITIFYLLFMLISGVIFLQNQKYYWKLSSQITKNVINDLKKYSPQLKGADTIYFVDLPDSSNNNSIWKAYVFRAGFEKLLNNFDQIYPKKVVFLTSKELSKIKSGNIVFIYNQDLKSVKLIKQ